MNYFRKLSGAVQLQLAAELPLMQHWFGGPRVEPLTYVVLIALILALLSWAMQGIGVVIRHLRECQKLRERMNQQGRARTDSRGWGRVEMTLRKRDKEEITKLLRRWESGDSSAFDELIPLVQSWMRGKAEQLMSRERVNHTLQPTALVNEAYLRFLESRAPSWKGGVPQFLQAASDLMRRILVDHARAKTALKRGGVASPKSLDEAVFIEDSPAWCEEVLDTHHALKELKIEEPVRAKIIELRFFFGLTIEEAAIALELNRSKVKRESRAGLEWLASRVASRTMEGEGTHGR